MQTTLSHERGQKKDHNHSFSFVSNKKKFLGQLASHLFPGDSLSCTLFLWERQESCHRCPRTLSGEQQHLAGFSLLGRWALRHRWRGRSRSEPANVYFQDDVLRRGQAQEYQPGQSDEESDVVQNNIVRLFCTTIPTFKASKCLWACLHQVCIANVHISSRKKKWRT